METNIQRLNPGNANVEHIDCKTTMCRATIVTRGEKDYDNFLTSVLFAPTGTEHVWEGPMFWSKEREEANGDWVMTIFFGQKGVVF